MALKIESAELATSDREGPFSPSWCRCTDTARRSLIGCDRDTYERGAEGSFKDVALDHSSVYKYSRMHRSRRSLHVLQLWDVDLEDSRHESCDDDGNLIFEVVSAVEERL